MKDNDVLYNNNLHEVFKKSVRLLMKEAAEDLEVGKHVRGLVASIISTEAKYEFAIEVALDATMQYVIVDDLADAKYLIDVMKRKEIGLVTFLPVSFIKPKENTPEILEAKNEMGALGLATELVTYDKYFEPVVSHLLGNILICNDTTSAFAIARKYPHRFRIVTLDGCSIYVNGNISGGLRPANAPHLLSHKDNN